MYLIWSNEHRGWWKGNRHGYTTLTHKAGHFSEAEAQSIVAHANKFLAPTAPRNEIMVVAPSRDQLVLDLEYPDR